MFWTRGEPHDLFFSNDGRQAGELKEKKLERIIKLLNLFMDRRKVSGRMRVSWTLSRGGEREVLRRKV